MGMRVEIIISLQGITSMIPLYLRSPNVTIGIPLFYPGFTQDTCKMLWCFPNMQRDYILRGSLELYIKVMSQNKIFVEILLLVLLLHIISMD